MTTPNDIVVTGLINIEITLRIEGFPIAYSPVRFPFFGVGNTVSGVGYNVTKALTTLGTPVRFLAMVGKDPPAALVEQALRVDGIDPAHIRADLAETPHSVILYDGEGRRQINVDLKDIQERAYPSVHFEAALAGCGLAVICNINFARPFLRRAREAGVPIATDVHTVAELEPDYDRDFMEYADILFMSDERLPCAPKAWIQQVRSRYRAEIIVVGLGRAGALMHVRADETTVHIPPAQTRPVVNTIGAGDALFSAFVHVYNKSHDPYTAIRKATVFASYKIGEKGAAEGFLTEAALERLDAEKNHEQGSKA